jgi:hypothetical protein
LAVVGAEDVMAMFDLIENGGQLAAQPLMEADAEDLSDAVGGEAPQADLTAALEDLVDGKVTLEDEVAAVLNLADGVEAGQVHLVPFFFGELGAQQEGPVIELLANDLRAQPGDVASYVSTGCYCTVTATAFDGIPFATTSRVLAPLSIFAGTSKLVETIALPVATAIVLWSCVLA